MAGSGLGRRTSRETCLRPPISPVLVLSVSVAAVSAAALLVRLAEGVSPVAAGFWRTAGVALLLLPSLVQARRTISRAVLFGAAAAGLLLALHFWVWFESLSRTTVFRSTLLVCLTPVWAGGLSWVLGGERPSLRFFVGVGLALVGVGWMAAGSPAGDAGLSGDVLALAGGMLAAGYLLLGRRVRPHVDIGPYGALVSGLCALWLLPVAWMRGFPLTGFSAPAVGALVGLTLGPQLLGHIGFNYAVRYLPAHIVSASILLEPVGAGILGALFLEEWPQPVDIGGSVVVLLGTAVATMPSRRSADA